MARGLTGAVAGVGAEELELGGLLLNTGKDRRQIGIEAVTVTVDEEDVDAQLFSRWTRLDLGEANARLGEWLQGPDQRAGHVKGVESQRRFVVAGGRGIFLAQDHEAGLVTIVVLDPVPQNGRA